MNKDEQQKKAFLEQQLQWTKDQDQILSEIHEKLLEMKKIAKYASIHELSAEKMEELNGQMNDLKAEIHLLEKQMITDVH